MTRARSKEAEEAPNSLVPTLFEAGPKSRGIEAQDGELPNPN